MDPIVGKAAADVVVAFLKSKIGHDNQKATSVLPSVDRHLREALNWSRRMQFYGMARAEETDAATISLQLRTEPRRFRGVRSDPDLRTERDLLSDAQSYVLLGDPGWESLTARRALKQPELHFDLQ